MRLILTRAVDDAARTTARLEALGHTVLASPVIAFEFFSGGWPRRPPQGLIATSARAFAGPDFDGPTPEERAAIPLFFVGRRTAEAAKRHGLTAQAIVTETVAALVPILRALPRRRLLLVAGVDRKFDLEDGLADSKHRLMVIETYEAVAATVFTPETERALRDGAVDAVLHYSRRSARIFLDLCFAAGVDPTGAAHLCLSADVVEPLRVAGCSRIMVAGAPNDEAMMAAASSLG